MKKIKTNFFLIIPFVVSIHSVLAQDLVDLQGEISASDDVEWIHVINKSSQKFTITDETGKFTIAAKLNDTILISALSYKPVEVVVDALIYNSKILKIHLEEKVNLLDEIVVGKVLTGDLVSDIENSEAKRELDFYDFGIPGNTKLPLTQAERRYKDANEGHVIEGLSINVHKLLNIVSGRGKRMKLYMQLEKSNNCLEQVISEYAVTLLDHLNWEDDRMADYFFFVSDNPAFLHKCSNYRGLQMFEFLKLKLEEYQKKLKGN